MSYPEDLTKISSLEDLLRRKEFFSLKASSADGYNFRDPGDDILAGKYLKVHSHQLFVRNLMNPDTPYKRLHLLHGCHAAGTPILMSDGRVKPVETIKPGEELLGDDGRPRRVLKLYTGKETMYKVSIYPDEYVCNESHILTVKFPPYQRACDISIHEFLQLPADVQRSARMFSIAVDWADTQLMFDPYDYGATVFKHGGGSCDSVVTARSVIIEYVSQDVLINSREVRLRFVAGYIDEAARRTDIMRTYRAGVVGIYIGCSRQIARPLALDIAALMRSLGYGFSYENTIIEIRMTADQFNELSQYRSRRETLAPVAAAGADPALTPFKITKVGMGQYYGFEIDQNGRYLLGGYIVTHNTGTGKTLAAISIAQRFAEVYKKLYANTAAKIQTNRRNYLELDRATPTIFVLGFSGTKAAFIRDMLKYPEFGFISFAERDELLKRQRLAGAGLPDDIKHFKEYYSHLKKRITNKYRGGFYKFFGYDEFVNRLFLSDEIKLTDLETMAMQQEERTLEDIIHEYIASGKIQVNQQLVNMFENSLLICDEIHNTFNTNMKNNRGVAIQYLLDTVPTMRFLSLSATPTNNSPTEIVELINYLVPPDQKVTKKMLFAGNRRLHQGAMEKMVNLIRGRLSFLQDMNLKYFPRRIFVGDPITLPKDVDTLKAGEVVPYLKFTECPMSEFHQRTHMHYLAMAGDAHIESPPTVSIDDEFDISSAFVDDDDTSTPVSKDDEDGVEPSGYTIPTDGYSIIDMVFPNPDSDERGLFRSGDVRNKIMSATQEWRDKNQISVKKHGMAGGYIISGEFLAGKNLAKYSTKYAKMLEIVMKIVREANGDPSACKKVMIYHHRVKMSGVLIVQEIMRANGFLDEFSEPVDDTICCLCGHPMSDHGETSPGQPHVFRPARFVMAHSEIDRTIMDQSFAKFNSPDNAYGLNYMFLIGSKIITESYDFKDIQCLIVLGLPTNIPTLIQVFGRCIRKNSHANLPPELRRVFIWILVTTMNLQYPHNDPISPEVYKYVDKLLDYMVIQQIERELIKNAIDADINRDINMPPELLAEYFPKGRSHGAEPVPILDNLYFEPALSLPSYQLGDLNLATFTAYKHYEEEIHLITYIIKRLFMLQPVWTYDDLWRAVQAPPVGIEYNPAMFLEKNFIIALHHLITDSTAIISAAGNRQEITETFLLERLFDYNERYIYIGGVRHRIKQIEKYYVLFPVSDIPTNPLNVVYMEYVEHIRDKERAMIKGLAEPNDRAIVDAETYLRPITRQNGARISVDAFIKESKENINYLTTKREFIKEYAELDNITGFLWNYSAQFQMSFLDEAIIDAMTSSKVQSNQQRLYREVIKLLDQFGVIVYLAEVAKYKDTAKQYKKGLPDLPKTTPLGYTTAKSVRLYDPAEKRWLEISKLALNRHVTYKENDVIVGYFENAADHMKFKLRKPIQQIKENVSKELQMRRMSNEHNVARVRTASAVADTRLIERGIVCRTKSKRDLFNILAALGVSVSKLSASDRRIDRLCSLIRARLIELEIKERRRDSRYKYLYSWWDEAVPLAAVI